MATKEELYSDIEHYRQALGLTGKETLNNAIELCERHNCKVGLLPFTTRGLRGMSCVDPNGPDIIMLNINRPRCENNFVCIHEALHIVRHKKYGGMSFRCYDDVKKSQNPFWEWEANEGAAELLMPYKTFIPDLVSRYIDCDPDPWDYAEYMNNIIVPLGNEYYATETMVDYRINNLKYEIAMYCSCGDMKFVKPVSKTKQLENNIHMERYGVDDFIRLYKDRYAS
jgi:Zn-dependent peptidase ImmA (M78 family)